VRAMAFFAAIALAPSFASAQTRREEARAAEMRRTAREHVESGRFEQAFPLLRAASALSADATVWLELGTLAERMRIDDVAIEAYQTYLARRTDAPDRAEIEGRVRLLRELAAGARYVLDERSEPVLAEGEGSVLVDWSGRPHRMARVRELITLAEWDGTLTTRSETRERSTVPGLGRRLSPP
jgi:hypothetical protein